MSTNDILLTFLKEKAGFSEEKALQISSNLEKILGEIDSFMIYLLEMELAAEANFSKLFPTQQGNMILELTMKRGSKDMLTYLRSVISSSEISEALEQALYKAAEEIISRR